MVADDLVEAGEAEVSDLAGVAGGGGLLSALDGDGDGVGGRAGLDGGALPWSLAEFWPDPRWLSASCLSSSADSKIRPSLRAE